ncbi:hypothetical protein CANCADRAFT_28229 [Tortispora caseinolytica NRRL Y-17796]|uniref:Vacuolar protein sorting-associated protein 35 n=1 Tax=Tortispora caseinolytica NRRL Y-17796 TaxID=767744 RepID=A0A1E4TAR0_9ASCO|nr:hypothetical protein CANCADRAFT_28229 [Tortispora caseinolytica NRRL Y-17796]
MTTASEENSQLLEEALQNVKKHAALMRSTVNVRGKLMDTVKQASLMLAELRTSSLGPRQYYELYTAVFDQLGQLTSALRDGHPANHLADVYELVQYAGNIVPRLYLMVTVGTAFMSVPDAPVKEIMMDMLEMCRGVQHPIRGLFLRYYLSQTTRNYLPIGTDSGPAGNLNDSVTFVLTNFVEMNKLWVRLQHQGPSKEREKRLAERQELQILVGSNLVRLSQLDGIDQDMYRETILPAILEQVVHCRDVLAQQYLFEVITQVFPDEFHLHTLDMLLDAIKKLRPELKVQPIITGLIDRLTNFAIQPSIVYGIPSDIDLFQIFWSDIQELLESRPDIPNKDVAELLTSLLNLSLVCYPAHVQNIDKVLDFATKTFEATAETPDPTPLETSESVQKLLMSPVNHYSSILTALALPHFISLLNVQPYGTRKAVSLAVLRSVIQNRLKLSTVQSAEAVFDVIMVLIKDSHPDSAANGTSRVAEQEQVVLEQGLIARMLHLLTAENVETEFTLLQTASKRLTKASPDRQIFTIPSLVFESLKVARRFKGFEGDDTEKKQRISDVFKFIFRHISDIHRMMGATSSTVADLCFMLFASAAEVADQLELEDVSYEFFAQAFTVYEESISDSRSQFQAVCQVAGVLQRTRNLSTESYDTLITKCALYGSKLLKKSDQCRAVYLASHLWWGTELPSDAPGSEGSLYRDGKRVLECLQRALRVADACMDQSLSVQLFVEILNQYVYYFERGNSAVTVKYLNGLIELIQNNLDNDTELVIPDGPRKHFQRTLDYISRLKETDERFAQASW